MSDNAVSNSVTPAGSFSVLNTESSQMVKCHLIKPLEEETMLSTLSFLKLVPENTFLDVCSSIWNPPSSMRCELEPTDNCSIQNNWSQVKKMPLTTSQEVITQSVKKSSISVWTESENSQTTVLDSKDSWFSTLSEVVPDLVWALYFWKDFQLITVKNPNSDLLSILLHKFQLQWLNLTILSSLPILY